MLYKSYKIDKLQKFSESDKRGININYKSYVSRDAIYRVSTVVSGSSVVVFLF
ncbi:hypothetical protein H1P_3130004 [Hyella patelloides LEGE 07179]|uniref:Uncharacterized protein n=1 Tax=Hyella patelloides LEGE 07179 TaxID=945734 RepID=A0A563VUV8_9CYAN|nr:hypothetical protein H1P_3130004 [Hyella patelloides LEGE 07179]